MKFTKVISDIKADLKRVTSKRGTIPLIFYKAFSNAGFRALFLYRIGRYFYLRKCHFIAGLCQRLMHHWSHCWISVGADIGPGLLIAHVGGLVIGGETRIGRNCDVRQNITFGGNFNKRSEDGRSQPWLEDNISVGVGAVIIGPVKVGSNSIIGANTVVNQDVPENSIFFGVPGQVIKEKWHEDSTRKL
jgi:serine O-acetyltransferase